MITMDGNSAERYDFWECVENQNFLERRIFQQFSVAWPTPITVFSFDSLGKENYVPYPDLKFSLDYDLKMVLHLLSLRIFAQCI